MLFKKKYLIILLFILPVSLKAQLKINEIMTNNVSAVMDNVYNYSMWVELYNTSTTTNYNQNAYYLTDDLHFPKKWKPGYKLMSPLTYNVIWFERSEFAYHASFKLDPEGGKLYLTNSNGIPVDSVVYPRQFRNSSYGRKTDGFNEWVFFEQYSPSATNVGKIWHSERCVKPVFNLTPGFYVSAQSLYFQNLPVGDTIYYTINGSEPTRSSNRYIPGNSIIVQTTRTIRARSFSKDKLPSDVVTSTYFMNVRNHKLPVVSIVTDMANLTDNTIGIYVIGTNGIENNGSPGPVNYNRPWDRPVNFELFDEDKKICLNQELDIAITGAYSRNNPQKSLKIQARKKFGDGNLRYDFFKSNKPNMKYRDIQLRNSGNDFLYCMMRDGFIQTLVLNRMNLDGLAYRPAVLYINGSYYGIQNLREETGSDFMYSNYGLDSEDIQMAENWGIPGDAAYTPLSNYISNNDITTDVVYNKVGEMMDIDEYMSYIITQIYIGNTDWPHNNVKIWKKKVNGKWRWILYDTDFGFGLYDTNLHYHNSLLYALGEKSDQVPADWSNLLLRRLILNEKFRNKFVDRFCIQISSTFEKKRVNSIMDSLASKISAEIVFHKSKWLVSSRTFDSDIAVMKTFTNSRPDLMMGFLSNRFANSAKIQTVHLSSNLKGISFQLNDEQILDDSLDLKYFDGRPLTLQADPVFGYRFKQWEVFSLSNFDLIKMGDTWKYFDGNALPSTEWNKTTFNDALWLSGAAQFGYGGKGEKTLISYGSDANNKYTTAYFRKEFNINKLSEKNKFAIRMFVDDGAVVYVNGQEVGRHNLPTGAILYNTFTTLANNGDYVDFTVPKEMLKEGLNQIAVEVHQIALTTSDMMFDLQLTCESSATSGISINPVYSVNLSSELTLKAVFEKTTDDVEDLPNIRINEVVANNNSILDDFGEKEDYIELYNTSDSAVNIAGWYITDTPVNRILAQIPATNAAKTTIPAHERLILWADNEPLEGLLHLGFKLGKEGETIVLSRKNAFEKVCMIDSVTYPPMIPDLSYSRVPDGSIKWFVQTPTFNSSNNIDVSVDKRNTVDVDLYPTLITESFTVRNATGMLLTLTDLTGKVVLRETCLSDFETFSVGSIRSGLYLVNVGNYRFKIIKR